MKASRMAALGANVVGGCCGVTPEHIGKLRVNVIGGCCGTTPDHIRRLREEVAKVRVEYAKVSYPNLKLSSRYMMKVLGFGEPFAVIGERLNPTARKKTSEDIRSGSYSMFKDEALAQEAAGADILDMNMGIPDTDEAALVKKASKSFP
jgi:5-methyltetrahydrofolate--homocysteine methyltransferase